MDYSHVPVLRERVVELLEITKQYCILDATVGLGGHSEALLQAFPQAKIIAMDRDSDAIEKAQVRLQPFGDRVQFIHGKFGNLDDHLRQAGVSKISGALFDLGLSSLQIDKVSRGFSYMNDGPLDMRMDPQQERTAADLINGESEEKIAEVLRDWGEEKFARRIARMIVARRGQKIISRTSELSEIVRSCVPGRKPISSLARVFQGVRMWTNGELENLNRGLRQILGVLAPGAVLTVLSYQSLEDRLVKRLFRSLVDGCVCPAKLPVCGCGFVAEFDRLSKRAIRPSQGEMDRNLRARSARLRALQRRSH